MCANIVNYHGNMSAYIHNSSIFRRRGSKVARSRNGLSNIRHPVLFNTIRRKTFPFQSWSLGACRSAAGRSQASWGGWFWVGRDVLEVPPFRNRLTLPGVPALSRPNEGRDQIAAIACPSRLCLFHVVSGGRHSVCLFLIPSVPALYMSSGRTSALYKRNCSRSLNVTFAAKGTI